MIAAKVVTIRYATVQHPKFWDDFRVYPNGDVYIWKVSDYNIDGWWSRYTDCEDYYEEVKQAGLEALEND